MEWMERLLKLCIDDQSSTAWLSTPLKMTKVLSWYDLQKKNYTMKENQFTASKDWFEWLKHCAAVHNVKLVQLEQECALNHEAEEVQIEPQRGLTIDILWNVFDNINLCWPIHYVYLM